MPNITFFLSKEREVSRDKTPKSVGDITRFTDKDSNEVTQVYLGSSVAETETKEISLSGESYNAKISESGALKVLIITGKKKFPDGFFIYDSDTSKIFNVEDAAKTSSIPPTFTGYLTSANIFNPAKEAVKTALEAFRTKLNAEERQITLGSVSSPVPYVGTFFNKGGKWNTEINAYITMIESNVLIPDFGKTLKQRVADLDAADKTLNEPIYEGFKAELVKTLTEIMNNPAVRNAAAAMNKVTPDSAAEAGIGKKSDSGPFGPIEESFKPLREAMPAPESEEESAEQERFTKQEEERKKTLESGLFDQNLVEFSRFWDTDRSYIAVKSAATTAGPSGGNVVLGSDGEAVIERGGGEGAAPGEPAAPGTDGGGADLEAQAINVDQARKEIVAVLEILPAGLKDPKQFGLDAATAFVLSQTIGLTEFKEGGSLYTEITGYIDNIENKRLPNTYGKPFSDRQLGAGARFLAGKLKSDAGPVIKQKLSESPDANKLMTQGARGAPLGPEAKALYEATLGFADLFGLKDQIVTPGQARQTGTTPGTDVSVPTGTTGAPPPPSGGESADGGAISSAGGTAVSSDSPSTTGGSAQPGAAAEVTDIAVAAVRILNARPVAVQVFMDFGPPRSTDTPQPKSLQWTIDPAYFGGYQLQISDSQRATIAQYKNQQVILRVSATPLTGGRPVEVKQPLSIRTYRLPDQAELVPIKTFTFGRLTGTQSVSPEPAAQGGARDFSKRVAEVPCFFYKADGGVSGPTGDTVGVNSSASGRTYRFDFPEGFLVPIRIKFDAAKNPKTADKLDKLRQEQGLLSESKGKILKEGGVPHWIFLKRRGALDSGRGGAGGGADEGADADAAGGLRVNIAVKTIVISTTDKLRVVGNTGNPWDASSFKAAFYPGKGAQFDKDEFPSAGLILCDDDFGLFSGLDRGAVMTAMYRVLFTDRAPASSAYKLVGLQKWADDIRVIGSNPEVSATARRKPDNLFASS
jgi:hypothetical protein